MYINKIQFKLWLLITTVNKFFLSCHLIIIAYLFLFLAIAFKATAYYIQYFDIKIHQ